MRKKKKSVVLGWWQVSILNRVVRVGLTETVTFKQTWRRSIRWTGTEPRECPKVSTCIICPGDTKDVV